MSFLSELSFNASRGHETAQLDATFSSRYDITQSQKKDLIVDIEGQGDKSFANGRDLSTRRSHLIIPLVHVGPEGQLYTAS